jgi:peptidoglycan/LPS O-acetylase OafA/YrhL
MDHRTRVAALDGLRGWAALSVVGFHFYVETFLHVLPLPVILALQTIFNGPVAVAIFFVLSGYVLTIGGWRTADKTPTLRLIAKRHARLAIPILVATVMVSLLVAAHLTFNAGASRIVRRQDWLGPWLDFSPDLASVLTYALGGVFLPGSTKAYLPFLWTMVTELWFSYIVLILCVLERRFRWPYLILLGIAAIVLAANHPVAVCFPLGAMLALAQRDGHLSAILPLRSSIAIVAFALLAGAVLRAFTYDEWGNILIGVILVTTVLLSPNLAQLLSGRVSQALGRLSFPLYLAQFPILVSLTSGLIVAWGAPGAVGAIVIGLVSIAATLALAALMLPVEWLAQWTGRQIGRLTGRLTSYIAAALSPVTPAPNLVPLSAGDVVGLAGLPRRAPTASGSRPAGLRGRHP